MKMDSPIGIFDSGLGGLTVVKRVLEKLPHESTAYLGDQIHVPYGERPASEICSFAVGITDFLVRQNAKMAIMACNMSSAVALDTAMERFPDIPIIGVIEAGARAAACSAHGGAIGVLATSGTVKARAYTRILQTLLPELVVCEQACPKFVPIVESGMCDTAEADEVAREYVTPLLAAGCRTLILGCTHYPFLMCAIRKAAGPDVTIIDPAEETAVQAANILFDAGLLSPPHAEPVHAYFTTGCPDHFAELGSRFLGKPVNEVQKSTWGLELREIECQETTVGRITNSAL